MRKAQKRQIEEFISLLEEAHGNIERYIENQNIDTAVSLLEQCQEGALHLGNLIESVEGEGLATISILEEYCEFLYQISEELGMNAEAGYSNRVCKKLRKMLIRIENSVRNDIAVQIEAVFLPYKASMWDSLESIWKAADADPHCDAYVVPIPYYDRDSNGNICQEHYEGALYPEYVPITQYLSYDFESHQPDIIFIHNPYDEFNRVTTVHPNFYSGNLKKLTNCLVYIDYGIPVWLSNRPEQCFTQENTSILPFMVNCDLYITYSLELAESSRFIMLHSEITKNLFNKDAIKNRIRPLGSPKFDVVVNSNKRDFKLLEDWKRKIGNKKILLYNTSLNELLKSSENFVNDISDVIEIISKRDDIVLWWRPHPLTLSTLKSMRPKLVDAYESLVYDFKNDNRGIFDDTSDLHRAIAWSDGCFTCESSLVFLYLATGKPFTIFSSDRKLQNPVCNYENTFSEPLERRITYMKMAKGANIGNWNCCIWWDNFLPEDVMENVHYVGFLDRFVHYIVHLDEYEKAEEYKELQLQMFRDFVANPDGTAGLKIYEYCKEWREK